MNKECTICKNIKSLEKFHKELKGKFGRKSQCADCCTIRSNLWKLENKDREIENRKKWNSSNSDRHKAATYKWRIENKDKHLEYVSEWQKARKSNDPVFKLLANVRTLVSNHFTQRKKCKTKHLESLLGISWEEFYNKILLELNNGMKLENYGSYWSFDHTCPCSIAKDEDELIKLQHWSNWKPMVHIDNLKKSDTITDEAKRMCINLLNRLP